MENESIEEARGFWNRFDALRGARTANKNLGDFIE